METGARFWHPMRTEQLTILPNAASTTTTDMPNDLHNIYEGCGEFKLCFGLPNGCVMSRNCNMLTAVLDNDGNFEFELLGVRKLANG